MVIKRFKFSWWHLLPPWPLMYLQIYSYATLENERDVTLMSHIYRASKVFVQGHRRNQSQRQDLHSDFSSTRLPNTLTKAFTSFFSVSASARTAIQKEPSQNTLAMSLEVSNVKKQRICLIYITSILWTSRRESDSRSITHKGLEHLTAAKISDEET